MRPSTPNTGFLPPRTVRLHGGELIDILLTHPYFWPHVTRGAEREIHDAGSRLAARGHDVRLITGQPRGLTSHRSIDGIRVRYVRTPLPPALARRGWNREAMFALPCGLLATTARADVALSYYYADVVGATALRRRRPVVLKLTGAVPRDRVDAQPVERRLLGQALDRAAEVWVNSRYVADAMSGWDREMHVVPAGVDTDVFRSCAPRSDGPLVACTAAPAEPRKRLVDLVDAWPAVVDTVPDARLMLVQRHDSATRAALLERLPARLRPTVVLDGPYDEDALAALYSRAWVTVAPAVHEALGLSTLESLACGTPVVGADSGATTELLATPDTGALYEPNEPAALASALTRFLTEPPDNATRDHCRAASLTYAWPSIINDYERRLTRILGR